MAIPSSYTEQQLAQYMADLIGTDLGERLNWTVAGGDFDEAVNAALLLYGVDDISTISGRANIHKLRVAARVEVWRLVMQATAHYHAFTTELGGSHSLDQIHQQARDMFNDALSQAVELGVSTTALPTSSGYALTQVVW